MPSKSRLKAEKPPFSAVNRFLGRLSGFSAPGGSPAHLRQRFFAPSFKALESVVALLAEGQGVVLGQEKDRNDG